jgi:hypothetical protein
VTDLQLRMLELRWRETGDLSDEVAYFQERLRLKATDRAGLELAATLGHRGARAILGDDAPEVVADPFFDMLGARRLPWDDPEFGVRVALAPARLLVEAWEERWPESKRARKALGEAIEVCRTKDQARAEARLQGTEAWKAERAQRSEKDPKRGQLRVAIIEALEAACRYAMGEVPDPTQAGQRAFWVLGKERVIAALQERLTHWALGLSDPLAEG